MGERRKHDRRLRSRTVGLLLIVYWTTLFVGTHLPPWLLWSGPDLGGGSDKGVHFAAFVGLSFLLAGYLNSRGWPLRSAIVAVLVTASVYGAVDELLQLPVGRHADVRDLAADVLGVLTGTTAAAIVLRWERRNGTGRPNDLG